MSKNPIGWSPTQVVLMERSGGSSPETIVSAWKWVGGKLPWFPSWFKAENMQDCLLFMLGTLSGHQLRDVLSVRAVLSEQPDSTYWEVIEASDSRRRVFFAPKGSLGIPGPEGALNIHWELEQSTSDGEATGYQRVMVSVFEPLDAA